ncbi:MAG TPA: glucosyl-3-phosphoglycerate synthase [Acidimicrobiales bacterium]|nr:glucosyl-3-phosphoglycerate synthase [Acidimicrobiales bacterium]
MPRRPRPSVTVILPARDEAATVGPIVACIRRDLAGVVDEVLVVDDASTDATAEVARAAGARVVATDGGGKGEAMWRGVWEAEGELLVYCDADVRNFTAGFVVGLLRPLLDDGDVALVKGYYRRSYEGRAGEGGRVTELMARPLLNVLFPALAHIRQPLGGECAAPRRVLERVPFVQGWGVDIGLVLDVAARWGAGAVAQADLGERVHRNRPLAELAPQAEAVLRTVLARAGLHTPVDELPPIVRPRASA